MARRACLAIGVGTVAPPRNGGARFEHLDGAPIAAQKYGEWAKLAGFGEDNVRVITDEYVAGQPNPVTRERVQQAVDQLFPDGADKVSHLVLVFCGHGLTDANFRSISWLFSDSLTGKYRVKADAFYAELLLHGVERVTLISDACREVPNNADLQRLDPVRGIAVGNDIPVESPKFDTLAACQDTRLGYMVMQPASAFEGKCVFSGVVLDALWGLEPTALIDSQITVSSLGACVQSRTPKRAKDYRLKLNPDCMVNPEDVVLYNQVLPLAGANELQPWPEPSQTQEMGVNEPPVRPDVPPVAAAVAASAAPAAAATSPEKGNPRNRITIDFSNVEFERGPVDSELGRKILGRNFGASHPELTAQNPAALPRSSRPLIDELIEISEAQANRSIPSRQAKQMQANVVKRLEQDVVSHARKKAANSVRRSVTRIRPLRPTNGANLIIAEKGTKIWSDRAVERKRTTKARQGFRIDAGFHGRTTLVEFADGTFAPVTLYQDLYTILKRSPIGDLFQAYGSNYSELMAKSAVQALDDFAAGIIDVKQVDRLSNKLRQDKHANPVLGVLCAYLYRATADFDNIRRMAYFYALNDQPIPFDIVLLGKMRVSRTDDDELLADVPAVEANDSSGSGPEFARMATFKRNSVPVGGRCPWLGQGWDYVADPHAESAALVEGLNAIAPDVPRRGFTVFPASIGKKLAKHWKLQLQS